jgi:hypothetical protein
MYAYYKIAAEGDLTAADVCLEHGDANCDGKSQN